MRFEEHIRLKTEIAWLARQPLPISLHRWNDFLDAIDEALRAEYVAGVDVAPTLAAREAVDRDEMIDRYRDALRWLSDESRFDASVTKFARAALQEPGNG